MNNLKIQTRNGFTLIELMVVITIIGLLASTVLASLSESRKTARDAVRVQTVKELQKALELYRAANNGNYKCATGGCDAGGAAGVSVNDGILPKAFITGIAPFFKPSTETFMNLLTLVGVTNTSASILYRLGSFTNDNGSPDRSTYTILLRREQTVGAIPANSWCSISSGDGHVGWNNTTAGQYPPCF